MDCRVPFHTVPILACLLVIAASIGHSPAAAVVRNWNNPAGGSAGGAINWTPNGVPTSADNLVFPLGAEYEVVFHASVPTVISHSYAVGVVKISNENTHTLTGSFSVGTTGNAGVNFIRGIIQARSTNLGLTSGRYGRLTLIPDPTLAHPLPPVFSTTDPTQPCTCGGDGAGRLEILGGSTLNAAGSLQLGANAGRCTLIVTGRSPAFMTSSGMVVGGPALVGTFGTAIARLDATGYLRVAGLINIGNTSTGNGTLLIGTTPLAAGPALYAAQDLLIGDSGFPSNPGGRALMQLTQGLVSVGGRTKLGDPDGNPSPAQLVIEGGTFIAGGGFTRAASTTLAHTGGILHVAGGTIEHPAIVPWEIDGPTVRPEVWVGTGTTSTLGNQITVGKSGLGLLRVVRPGTRLATTGAIYMGELATGSGRIVVDSGGIFAASGLVASRGIVEVKGGGRLEASTVLFEQAHGVVSGPGSTLFASTYVDISGGTGNAVTVTQQGLVEAQGTDASIVIGNNGRLVATDGGIARAPDVLAFGVLQLAAGIVDATGTRIWDSGGLIGHGDLLGTLEASGLLDPAPSTGSYGTLRVAGATTLDPENDLAITLGGGAGQTHNDSLTVQSGGLVLNGRLMLEGDASFVESPGDTFVIATAPQVSGAFSAVTWNNNPLDGEFDVVVQPTRVLVVSRSGTVDVELPADAATAPRFAQVPGTTAFALELPAPADVRVSLHDVMGRRVALVHDGALAAGTHRLQSRSEALGSGVYFARATVTRGGRSDVLTVKTVRIR